MQGELPGTDRARTKPLSLRAGLAWGLALATLTAILLVSVNVLSASSATARVGTDDAAAAVVATPQPVSVARVTAPAGIAQEPPPVTAPAAQQPLAVPPSLAGEPDLVAIAEAQSDWYLERLAEAQAAQAAQAPAPVVARPAPAANPPATAPITAPAAPAAAPAPVAAPVAPAPAPVTAAALSAREIGLFQAMNRERIANGLAPLQASGTLLPIARARSEDMSVNGYFAHFSPSGESVYTLTAAAGLRFSALGENLARVSGDEDRSVAVAIDKLMQSPPHRANILSAAYTQVAVGAVTDEDGVTVFTTVFAGG